MSGRAAEGSVSADPAASLRRNTMRETFFGVTTVPYVLTYLRYPCAS